MNRPCPDHSLLFPPFIYRLLLSFESLSVFSRAVLELLRRGSVGRRRRRRSSGLPRGGFNGVEVVHNRPGIQFILLRHYSKSAVSEQVRDLVRTAINVMDFYDDLPEAFPVFLLDPLKNVKLALLNVYL